MELVTVKTNADSASSNTTKPTDATIAPSPASPSPVATTPLTEEKRRKSSIEREEVRKSKCLSLTCSFFAMFLLVVGTGIGIYFAFDSDAGTLAAPGATCPPIQNPVNGLSTCTSDRTPWAKLCEFSCSSGYSLVGSASLSCLADGSWSGAPPTCI